MEIQNTYRYLVGGYYGISMIDEYPLKEYMLMEIDKYINNYVETNNMGDFDYISEREKIKNTFSDRVKLQDSLLLLQKMSAPMDLVFLVKARLKKLGKRDNF